MASSKTPDGSPHQSFIHRAVLVVGITAITVLLLLLLWQAVDVLLLIFAAVLLSIILKRMSDFVARHSRLGKGVSLGVVVFVLLGILISAGILVAPVIKEQVVLLAEQIPESWQRVKSYLQQFGWSKQILDEISLSTDILDTNKADMMMVTRIVGLFSSTLGALVSTIFILIVAIYLAAEPDVYINGMLRLLPIDKRPRAKQVLHRLGETIRWWLFGQSLSMLILGMLTTLSLWILDIPLALTLGLLAAVMTFIPNLGPMIAGAPTFLIALAEGPAKAFYVAVLYIIIQSVEGYFITPMVHRKIISIPPVFILSVQILLLSLIGFLGVLLAMPLVACSIVLVQMLYVEDVLGDSLDDPV